MIALFESFSATKLATERVALLGSLSAQAAHVQNSDVVRAFSAESIKTNNNMALIRYLSTSKAGYDINGTEIAVPNMHTYITRVK